MKAKAILSCVILFCLCGPSIAADKIAEFEPVIGYEYNNNVIYSEFTTEEGADYISSGYLRASVSPFASDAFSVKFGGSVNFSDYQKRSEFNTHGQSGDVTLMYHPLEMNYFYLMLGSSTYTIGDQTDSSSKTSSIQYVFDVSASSRFWTTLFLDRADDSFSDPSYAPLAGPSTTIGVKQNLTEWVYLLAKSVDYRAGEEDLTYKETTATIGADDIATPWFGISAALSAGETRYKEPWFFFPLKKRDDMFVSGNISFSREILASLKLEVEYNYMNNRCNLMVEETRQGYASYNQSAVSVLLAFLI